MWGSQEILLEYLQWEQVNSEQNIDFHINEIYVQTVLNDGIALHSMMYEYIP